MPLNNYAFNTSGDWDSTFVILNGENWDAARSFKVELRTFDENDNDGGIDEGGTLFGEVSFVDPNINPGDYTDPLAMPLVVQPIFPGTISFTAVGKPTIVFENIDPDFEFLQTRVSMDGVDITDDIVAAKFEIDAIKNVVLGWIKYVDSSIMGINNVATLYIL